MEALSDLIRRVVNAFNAAGLDYMFTGAFAASFYGVPRTTVDIDVVVETSSKSHLDRLVAALRQAGLRVDEQKIDAALKSGYRQVALRNSKSPSTVDVIFSPKRLEKRAGTIDGLPTFFQTPEDLILAKLRMIKATVPRERALKDKEDIRAILKFTKVDVKTVKEQARKNNTLSIFVSITTRQ